MATDESDKTAMEMLFTFYTKPDKPLIIDGLSKLPIDEQLNIIKIDNISSQKGRKELTRSLFDKLPDLKDNAHKRIRFKSILSSYYKSYQELDVLQVSKWKKKQVPLSLFIYLIKSLQSVPSDEKAIKEQQKAKKNSASFWKFIYYLLKYVNDQSFDGEELKKFYDEITNFGEKPGGFGLKFVQKICGQYSLKFGKFAKVKKNVGVWVTDNVNKSKSGSKTSNAYGGGKQNDDTKKGDSKSGGSTTSTSTTSNANKDKGNDSQNTGTKSSGPPPKEQASSSAKWHWMDMEEFQWVPYTDIDQEKIHKAFNNKETRCNVVGGKYRIEFDEGGSAAGNQFQNNVADPINHMVICAEPEDGQIHGMAVADKPKGV